ncbi:MAG: hypothetical protein VX670_09865, partial [Candidatus Latescibacterota bacterium]|nr:hypothetical protein [Candidatus Latescibacterota bacterium]
KSFLRRVVHVENHGTNELVYKVTYSYVTELYESLELSSSLSESRRDADVEALLVIDGNPHWFRYDIYLVIAIEYQRGTSREGAYTEPYTYKSA